MYRRVNDNSNVKTRGNLQHTGYAEFWNFILWF